MSRFRTPTSVGVVETFLVMAACYFVMMNFGAFIVRVPPPDWTPEGSPAAGPAGRSHRRDSAADDALKTPQFYLLWGVLCCNVTAGIGILAQASPMCQDMFGVTPVVAGGFVGLLSIFNTCGRFAWSSASDFTGRKAIYVVYFLLGCALYCLIPVSQRMDSVALFVALTCVIISMYGGGFATIPAYLRDLFGTVQVGAIHGRVITAWSVAAVLGPQLVTYLSAHSAPRASRRRRPTTRRSTSWPGSSSSASSAICSSSRSGPGAPWPRRRPPRHEEDIPGQGLPRLSRRRRPAQLGLLPQRQELGAALHRRPCGRPRPGDKVTRAAIGLRASRFRQGGH